MFKLCPLISSQYPGHATNSWVKVDRISVICHISVQILSLRSSQLQGRFKRTLLLKERQKRSPEIGLEI